MSLTPSSAVEIGTSMPEFSLPDASGKQFHSADILKESKNGVLVLFICNHCPYVVHVIDCLAMRCEQFFEKGITTIAINSNDVERYPADAPDKMLEFAKEHRFSAPYLFDENQAVAKAFDAQCTPDIFLFDSNAKLFYHGQFDDSRPGNSEPVNGSSLVEAADNLLAGKPAKNQIPSVGCNIKWK